MMYDDLAAEYAEHAERSPYNARYERPAVQAHVGDVAGKRVLDAGCAAGGHAELLIARGAHVLAIDRSAAMIALVRERCAGVDARVHDLSDPMPWLASASLHAVVCSLALHYLESWDVPLAEFRRALGPGGRLVLSTHHPAITAPLAANYFATQLVEETWRVGTREVAVRFFHRPLEAIVAAVLDAGFVLDALVEPRLGERDADVEPRAYARLSREPNFLILVARAPD